jgi:hypothetical protein
MPRTQLARNLADPTDPTDPAGVLPFSVELDLVVRDRDCVRELLRHDEGERRDEFALEALRIGVLALRQAQGQIDAAAVRQEGDRLLHNVKTALEHHSDLLNQRMTTQLRDYFDPQTGRFQERVERLIRQDGELEQLLRRSVGDGDSELCRTLATHVGGSSPLMRLLDPAGDGGLTAELRQIVEDKLREQRETVLRQFSLDHKDGALCRFLAEIKDHYEGVSGDLTTRIDKAVGEFSLDDDNSALSRLVRNVTTAQETITREFSLDEKASALSRLRGELVELLQRQDETNQKFQEEVKVAIAQMQARRAESERSTRHGLDFEQAVFEFVEEDARRTRDVAEFTANTVGLIKNCKKGDAVVHLGPESPAPGAKIALEAKADAGCDLKAALEELDLARKNRDSQIGLFVYSRKTAPAATEPLARYGQDIVVVWDVDDAASDLYLRVALTLARALCIRAHDLTASQSADFTEIDRAILEVEKRAKELDEIRKGAESIKSTADNILKRQGLIRDALDRQLETLRDRTAALRQLLPTGEGS